MQVVMQGGSEEYYIINARADVSSRYESLKGMSERSELIPCISYIITKLLKDNLKCLADKQPKTEDNKK